VTATASPGGKKGFLLVRRQGSREKERGDRGPFSVHPVSARKEEGRRRVTSLPGIRQKRRKGASLSRLFSSSPITEARKEQPFILLTSPEEKMGQVRRIIFLPIFGEGERTLAVRVDRKRGIREVVISGRFESLLEERGGTSDPFRRRAKGKKWSE